MKIKKFLAAVPAVCLLLTAFSVPTVGAVDSKTVTSGATVELMQGDKQLAISRFNSPKEAWEKAVSSTDRTGRTETVVTLGTDWVEDELLTAYTGQHLTLDLNGHYVKRNRDHKMKSEGEVFRVNGETVFTIRDSNPKSEGYDGIKGGVITGGASSNTGGAVQIDEGGEFRLKGGTIYDCMTDEDGGAIYLAGSTSNTKFTMTGGRIYACKTIDSADECYGGAIYMRNGVINISNAKIDDCYSEDDGGAIFSERGTINLNNVVFSGNKSREQGGAIRTAHDISKYVGTKITAYKCTFAGNNATEEGGAVFINDNPEHNEAVVFHECKFRNNSAKKDGGAIYINDDNVALSSCEITGNSSEGYGGGVYVDGRYNITLKGKMIIKDNESKKGKGASNLLLENANMGTARVINGGLYRGSDVHVGTNASGRVVMSEWMSRYQTEYFTADDAYTSFADERKVESTMITSSIFSEGGFYAILIIGCAGIIGTIILIVYKKRKKKAAEGGEEND
jgi:predicted outer membrane repeat protein